MELTEHTLSISELSEKTGLSIDTIRYYEKIGILPSPHRKSNGQREYTSGDLERFIFITHLKRTQMPLKEIDRYIQFYMDQDYEGCFQVLQKHKEDIEVQMAEMSIALEKMNYKLDNFKSLVTDQNGK
ncbi:MerR family transcriptional regulator [Paenibacillus sp. CGMCC 1.16610]|uniref:MerR family transcriptional regulator n=1 Tax=Paenibacillus anseongense TaxID=2682845 RepID=A0ABW9ULC6_9BACL|nr:MULTISPECIES: MerR family transcriptional regulator [Paenibacillus]MBA2941149.1 MerR family transcriptional regulator [Paenibacillus sp. CGMCC 1.16610]MVQ39968.1 MerR family transcriptional regulator [Paenibacillus anseongense]